MILKTLLKFLVRTMLHLLFWSGVLLFYTYFFGVGTQDVTYVLRFSLFLMPITIATTYVSIYKLMPDYLITKQYGRFVLYSVYTLIVSGYLIVMSVFFGLIYLSNFEYEAMAPISKSLLLVMIAVYLVVLIVSGFKLLKINLEQSKKTIELQKKILETQLKLKDQELQYLKMQIHPHFLFNTLNTMYGFALKKADETPEMILKLSNLLDYLLYRIDKPFVLLEEEIQHIQDYLELEKLRFHDTLQVNFTLHNIHSQVKIAPMLLLPFVENSFKHGHIKNGVLNIEMNLSCEGEQIQFSIENSSHPNEESIRGIGLPNIQKRLDLLYPNTHQLDISPTETTFKVNLILKSL